MLVQAYIALLGMLILSLLYYIVKIKREKSELRDSVIWLLLCGIMAVVGNLIFVIAKNQTISTIGFSIFSAMIDWMLIMLLIFTHKYAENERRWTGLFKVLVGFAAIDSLSLLFDAKFHHIFTLYRDIFLGKYEIYIAGNFTNLYILHLLVDYLCVVRIIHILISKSIHISKVYRKKYSVVLAIFSIVIILDALCVALHIPLNVSIVFYGFLAIAISYYAIFFQSKQLLSDMQAMILDHSNNGIACFDVKGKCMYVNNGLYRMFQLSNDDSRMNILYGGLQEQAKMQESRTLWNEEHTIGGVKRYIEIERQNMYDKKGYYVGSCFTLIDRTQQHQSFEMEIDAANESNRAKSEFLSRVSHDIRTPVNSIFGMNEMILRESKEVSTINYANRIKDAVEVLLNLINDVLDFSKIEAGKMTLVERTYDTNKMFSSIIDIISIQAKKKNLEFHCDIARDMPAKLLGDDVRIEQILMNLLSNAVKYTARGSVTLRAECRKDWGKFHMIISVEDSGIGIKPQDIPKLFNAFERIEELKNHSIQGTGLGLNITSYLLRLMNSALKVESEYGKGSKFSFDLEQEIVESKPMIPLGIDKQHESGANYKQLFIAPKAKILVVDDNEINRFVFTSLLGATQMQIDEASSGQECLYMTKKKQYHMIFMDHMMPELDGVETFHRLRNDKKNLNSKIPVIALTANVVVGAKEMYLNEGFDGYLTKPFEPEKVERLIMDLLPSELIESV